MKNYAIKFSILTALVIMLSSCEMIGGIFNAGMGVGIFIAIIVVGLIIFAISKMGKSSS